MRLHRSTVPDDALRLQLERSLRHSGADAVQVVRLARRPSEYRTSFAIEEVDADLSDGRRLELILKDTAAGALSAEARRLRPAFLYDPLREAETYRRILAPERVEAPVLYAAVTDQRHGAAWLLLERVRGHELWREGDFNVWQETAAWLARLHGRLAPVAAAGARGARLLHYDARLLSTWVERAARFGRLRGPLGRLPERYGAVVAELTSLASTVIHGELYASNVMVRERNGRSSRPCALDWELAGVGPGGLDLAALTAGTWSRHEREILVRCYYDALPARDRPSRRQFDRSLDYCRLHVAVQWLGWASDWAPPEEHRHDWGAEAAALVDDLLP